MFENMITIPSSIINMIEGGMYDHLISMKIFIEIISKSSKHYEESVYNLNLELLTILYQMHVSIS